MAYEAQTREQILEAEVELLRFRLNELLGTELQCPIESFSGAHSRMVNLLAKRSPQIVAFESLYHAITNEVEAIDNPVKLLRVQIHLARRRLKKHGIEIENIFGLGYRMPAESAAKWQALVDAANPDHCQPASTRRAA